MDDERDTAPRSLSSSVSRVHTGRGAVPRRTIFGPISCQEEDLLEAYLSPYRLTSPINKRCYMERRLQGRRVAGRRRRGVDAQRRAHDGGRSRLPSGSWRTEGLRQNGSTGKRWVGTVKTREEHHETPVVDCTLLGGTKHDEWVLCRSISLLWGIRGYGCVHCGGTGLGRLRPSPPLSPRVSLWGICGLAAWRVSAMASVREC